MKVAIYIKAKNCPNGNPRRGWYVHETPDFRDHPFAQYLGFVDEGYSGKSALFNAHPGTVILCSVNVTAREYLSATKGES